MSHGWVRPASAGRLPLEELLGIGGKLLVLSLDSTRAFIRQAVTLFPPLPSIPDCPALRLKDPCEIPEVECPPRCVCEATWEASPGETVHLTVRVTNASRASRTFHLQATPFRGPGPSPGTITLTPPSLSLGSGRTDATAATFVVPNVAEGDYESEILVRGAYEQCVRVTLKIRCAKTCGVEHCTCTVVQGDPPQRIRAHRWYDHFQCTEPCVEDQPDHGGHRG
jgi:hypothetical protein